MCQRGADEGAFNGKVIMKRFFLYLIIISTAEPARGLCFAMKIKKWYFAALL